MDHNTPSSKEMPNLDKIKSQLFLVVSEFLKQSHKIRAIDSIRESASIDRDLGIDSLGRVELFQRIEKTFNVYLPDNLIIQAVTLKDIITALSTRNPSITRYKPKETLPLTAADIDLSKFNSLTEIIYYFAENLPNRPHVYFQDDLGIETLITYKDLLESSKKVANGLAEVGIGPRDTVAIMLPTSPEFFYAYMGTLLVGGVPVPIYPPFRPDVIEEYSLREANILKKAEAKVLITFDKAEKLSKLLKVFIPCLQEVITVPRLMQSNISISKFLPPKEFPGLIQFTSGSTSEPKGVLLNHSNLLANIRSVAKAIQVQRTDIVVSWLPLYHDLGLIGMWLGSFYNALPITIMSPLSFLAHPERWLWAIHYHKATLSGAPNFAFELCTRRIDDKTIEGLDLSSLRIMCNGAEAINTKTYRAFVDRFRHYGLRETAFTPVYGLAESTVGLLVPEPNTMVKVDKVSRESFANRKEASPAKDASSKPLEFVSCGKPIPDHSVKIVDDKGCELPDRKIGTLYFKGPSSMQGYYKNIEATEKVFKGEWVDSGDYAYSVDGEIYITGRKKDLIIKAGRNFYPEEVEELTSQVTGVRKGCVIVFGVKDKKLGTEKLIVVAETKDSNAYKKDKIIIEVNDKISSVLGITPDEVIIVKARTIPKTSSGKLQRSKCKQDYIDGKLGGSRAPVWMQVARLSARGLGLKLFDKFKKGLRFIYSVYVGTFTVLAIILAWSLSFVLSKKQSVLATKFIVRVSLLFFYIRITTYGKENIDSSKNYVFISNHASYLDAIVLLLALPSNALFVSKIEAMKYPFIGRILKKYNYITVDREDLTKNISDVDTIIDSLKQGNSVIIFPEGTFKDSPGILPFKLGAFKSAAKADIPVLPIALTGTRSVMRGDSLLLRPGKVEINFLPEIIIKSQDFEDISYVLKSSRRAISQYSNEPMLD